MFATLLGSMFASGVGSVFVFVCTSPGTTCHIDLADQSTPHKVRQAAVMLTLKWQAGSAVTAATAERHGEQSDEHGNLGTASPCSHMKREATARTFKDQ